MRKEYDFSKAKPVKDVPHLKELQSNAKGKNRITIMLDTVVLEGFRQRAASKGAGYQTLINKAFRDSLEYEPLTEADLRRVVREELGAYEPSERK